MFIKAIFDPKKGLYNKSVATADEAIVDFGTSNLSASFINGNSINTVVPNISSMSGVIGTKQVWVESVRDYFTRITSSSRTIDGIEVLATDTGIGRWERSNISHPSWLRQDNWYIDPISGSDEARGVSGSSIKTAAELERRLGLTWNVLQQYTTLNILSDLPVSDSLHMSLTMGDYGVGGTKLFVKGTRTVITSGTVTTHTPLVRTSGSEAKNTLTSTGFDFSPYVGSFIRMTTGTGAGYRTIVLVGSVGTGSVSSWVQELADPPDGVPTATGVPLINPVISPGDNFEVVGLPSIGYPNFSFRSLAQQDATPSINANSYIIFKDLKVAKTGQGSLGNVMPSTCEGQGVCRIVWQGCDLGGMRFEGAGVSNEAYGCRHFGGVLTLTPGGGIRFFGGAALGGSIMQVAGVAYFDGDFIFQGVQLNVGTVSSLAAIWQAGVRIGTAGHFSVAGDAILVQPNGLLMWQNGSYSAHQSWGSGSTGAGLKIYSGGKGIYVSTKPTVRGATTESVIGGTTTAYSAIPFVNTANLAMLVQFA